MPYCYIHELQKLKFSLISSCVQTVYFHSEQVQFRNGLIFYYFLYHIDFYNRLSFSCATEEEEDSSQSETLPQETNSVSKDKGKTVRSVVRIINTQYNSIHPSFIWNQDLPDQESNHSRLNYVAHLSSQQFSVKKINIPR